jgi:hypothetical protein
MLRALQRGGARKRSRGCLRAYARCAAAVVDAASAFRQRIRYAMPALRAKAPTFHGAMLSAR